MLMLSELNKGGRTVILITHENDIAAYAKRVVRLRDGLIIDDRRLVAVQAPPPVVGAVTGEDRVFSRGMSA
jgi:putative ABC transport system ATP-binding protein